MFLASHSLSSETHKGFLLSYISQYPHSQKITKTKKGLRLFNIISTAHSIIINMACTRGHKLSLLVAYYVPDFFSVLTTDANHHERHIQLSEEVAW